MNITVTRIINHYKQEVKRKLNYKSLKKYQDDKGVMFLFDNKKAFMDCTIKRYNENLKDFIQEYATLAIIESQSNGICLSRDEVEYINKAFDKWYEWLNENVCML